MAVMLRNFDDFVSTYDEREVEKIAFSFPFSEEKREELRGMMKFVFEVMPQRANFLTRDVEAVEAMSKSFRPHPSIADHFVKWKRRRITMINMMDRCAKELDDMEYHLAVARTVSSCLQLLTSFHLGLSEGVSALASSVSPLLGVATHAFFEAAPFFCYLGVGCSVVEIKKLNWILRKVCGSVRDDAESFEPLRVYLEETRELDEKVQKLFPHRVNEDLVRIINETFSDFDVVSRIFSSVYVSNVIVNSTLYRNGPFLDKVLSFYKTQAAAEWFSRTLRIGRDIPLLSTVDYLQKEISSLQKTPSNESIVEFFNLGNKYFQAPRTLLVGVNIFLVYYGYRSLAAGGKHCCSDLLRNHAKSSQNFLKEMEKIGNRLSPLPLTGHPNESSNEVVTEQFS